MDDSKVKKKKIFYPFLFAFFSAMNFRGFGILDLSQDFLQKFLELTVLSQFFKEKLILKNERGLNLEKFEKLAEISQIKFINTKILWLVDELIKKSPASIAKIKPLLG